MNIQFRTKRQFDAVLRKEGKTIIDYISGEQYRVFFRSMKHSDSTAMKLRLYYPKEVDIKRGTIFTIYNQQFLVVNQDSIESEIYCTSVAVRCTQKLLCSGVHLPFVVSDLKNVYPTGNSVMSIVGGAITLYSGDNDMLRSVSIDDSYVCCGGTYKVINTFYNDGLGYLYLSREAETQSYTLTYAGLTQLAFEEGGTYQLSYEPKMGKAIVSDATITYKLDSDSVATVDANGLLTMLTEGAVKITATWVEQNITCETDITIKRSGDTITCTLEATSNVVRVNTAGRVVTAKVMLNGGTDVSYEAEYEWSTSDWTGTLMQEDLTLTPKEICKCTVATYNEDVIDETFNLNVKVTYNGCTATASKDMVIEGMF